MCDFNLKQHILANGKSFRPSENSVFRRPYHTDSIYQRSSRRRILPTLDFGNSSRNSMSFGTLYAVSSLRQKSISSSLVKDGSLRTTKTLIASPVFSLATPIQATSKTLSLLATTSSISFGYTLKPDTTINLFAVHQLQPAFFIHHGNVAGL